MNSPTSSQITRAGELLSELVLTPSVNPAYDASSPGERPLAELVARRCDSLGMNVDLVDALPGRPNVIARLQSPRPTGTLLYEVHTDTVSLPAGQTAPTSRTVDGRLYGRGACDAKGGLAALLLALEDLAAERSRLRMDIVLLGAIDEEHKYQGVLHYLNGAADATVAVVVEPTNLAPVISHSGCVRVRIAVAGRAAHSSRPHEGRNAILDAFILIEQLRQWNEDRVKQRPASRPVTLPILSVNRIVGGHAFNIVPDQCTFDVDIRTLPNDDPGDILDQISKILLATEAVGAEVVDVPVLDYGLETPSDSPLVLAAATACAAHGAPSAALHVTFGTDASKLDRLGSVPSIVLGPGSIDQAHAAEEWVSLYEVVTASRIYADIARVLSREA